MANLRNVVQETKDYEKFQFIDANRPTNRGHIERLKAAFQEVGNLTMVQPILVNNRYQIIDGQHRFVACTELGLPIYYTMVEGIGINEARGMNILHRGWTVDDYLHSYLSNGLPAYKTYQELREDYGFSHSITLGYIYAEATADTVGIAGGNGRTLKVFREGDLKINDEAKTREYLNKLYEISEFTTLANHRPFAMCMLKIMKNPEYNHAQFMKKLRLAGDRFLKRYVEASENYRMIEELYNYNQREGHRTRLY